MNDFSPFEQIKMLLLIERENRSGILLFPSILSSVGLKRKEHSFLSVEQVLTDTWISE